jgi:hypothetical protein
MLLRANKKVEKWLSEVCEVCLLRACLDPAFISPFQKMDWLPKP